jgi:hypothetical protein
MNEIERHATLAVGEDNHKQFKQNVTNMLMNWRLS